MRFKLYVDYADGRRVLFSDVSNLTAMTLLLDLVSNKAVSSFIVERTASSVDVEQMSAGTCDYLDSEASEVNDNV